ncbi:hypothetical protein NUSPORA_00001 [Nucleospora cyclopteri]
MDKRVDCFKQMVEKVNVTHSLYEPHEKYILIGFNLLVILASLVKVNRYTENLTSALSINFIIHMFLSNTRTIENYIIYTYLTGFVALYFLTYFEKVAIFFDFLGSSFFTPLLLILTFKFKFNNLFGLLASIVLISYMVAGIYELKKSQSIAKFNLSFAFLAIEFAALYSAVTYPLLSFKKVCGFFTMGCFIILSLFINVYFYRKMYENEKQKVEVEEEDINL